MKKIKTSFICLLFLSFIISCSKDEQKMVIGESIEIRSTNNILNQDTSGWELVYIYNLMDNMDKSDLLNFLNMYGYPSWNNSIQKRSASISITSIPMIKGDSISGIVKMYETDDDTTRVDFFSIEEINNAIISDLNTSEYHAYRGAIQSLILCAWDLNINLNSKYLDWLVANNQRVQERLKFYCIEFWDCGTYVSETTGWTSSMTDNPYLYSDDQEATCLLISRECWVDWTPRNFPSSWTGGGSTQTGGTGNGTGGTGKESIYIKNAKIKFLTETLNYLGLSLDLLDELYPCVGYFPHPNNPNSSVDVFLDNDCFYSNVINLITINNENENTLALLTSWILSKNNKPDALAYIELVSDLISLEPEIRWDRSLELYDLLENNPNALTECDNPSNISDWSDLANFVPPSNVLARLAELGEGWRLQGFQTPTAAPSINLDYFSTTITQMPINPSTSQVWTADGLFQHIRKNINNFVDITLSEFTPLSGDEQIWLSNNPISSVISINIPPDDGSVICAQNESCCWIFSTVTAPGFTLLGDGNDGYHPVSGNRQFGYKLHPNGSMEIYTKGADRFFSPQASPFTTANGVGKLIGYLMEKIAFPAADGLWVSFQQGIQDFVNDINTGGSATINTPIKKRPKVKNELKNILKQSGPINYVPCGN